MICHSNSTCIINKVRVINGSNKTFETRITIKKQRLNILRRCLRIKLKADFVFLEYDEFDS